MQSWFVDVSALAYRATYGGSTRTHYTPSGKVSIVASFLERLMDLVMSRQGRSGRLAWCADPSGRNTNWRFQVLKQYKEGRNDSEAKREGREIVQQNMPWLKELALALGGNWLEDEAWEADDIIAWCCANYPAEDHKLVVTSDADLVQLVQYPNVEFVRPVGAVWESLSADTWATDAAKVLPKTSRPPENLVPPLPWWQTFKVLVGDKSDGISGALGVGKSNAAKLIAKYGDLSPSKDPWEFLQFCAASELASGKSPKWAVLCRDNPDKQKQELDLARDVTSLVPAPAVTARSSAVGERNMDKVYDLLKRLNHVSYLPDGIANSRFVQFVERIS